MSMDDNGTRHHATTEPLSGGEPRHSSENLSVEELQRQLEETDPAGAPHIAEELATRLGERLDGDTP